MARSLTTLGAVGIAPKLKENNGPGTGDPSKANTDEKIVAVVVLELLPLVTKMTRTVVKAVRKPLRTRAKYRRRPLCSYLSQVLRRLATPPPQSEQVQDVTSERGRVQTGQQDGGGFPIAISSTNVIGFRLANKILSLAPILKE